MFFFLILLSSSFVMISSQCSESFCDDYCNSIERLKLLCNITSYDDKRATRLGSPALKLEGHTNVDDSNMLKPKSDIFELITKTPKDSSRLLTRRQLQNLEDYALYNYYLRAFNN